MLPRLLARLLKTMLLLLVVLVFLMLQLHAPGALAPPGDDQPSELERPPPPPPAPEPPPPPPSPSGLADTLARLNSAQTVRAPGGGAPTPLNASDVVVVVQVHTRIDYLRQLIASLRAARHIERVLLVFSHDVFDADINAAVAGVDFCRVMQIFYPFSLQLHGGSFPGQSKADCGRDVTRSKAMRAGCTNRAHPDKYGHYREARFTQTKHHWWWKANRWRCDPSAALRCQSACHPGLSCSCSSPGPTGALPRVFDQLAFTRTHSGLFLFLEEDHYVAPDFLHVLQLMSDARHAHCRHCNVLSLGTYLKVYNYKADASLVELTPWHGSKHNMGMALQRATWEMVRACTDMFCSFDDYNWDWSLQYISQNGCIKQKLHAMVAKAPRVFHIGECGVHHRGKNCDKYSLLKRVLATLHSASRYLFPSRLTGFPAVSRRLKLIKGNGGWGDPRDHRMCATGRLPPQEGQSVAPAVSQQAL